ncbi:MAG: transglycosylase domain-containing protein [Deltaproteobacteria bacterium]|nr:transglycosylase domain-containing protein [Deltaproteobacteria bacterium]
MPASVLNTARKVRRRWPWALAGAAVTVVVLAALLFLAVAPMAKRIAKDAVDQRLMEASKVIGREVTVEGLTSGITEDVVFEGLQVRSRDGRRATLRISRIKLDFTLWDAVMGRRLPGRVEAQGVAAFVYLENGVPSDLIDLYQGLRRLGGGGPGGKGPAGPGEPGLRSVVAQGTLEVVNEGDGIPAPTTVRSDLSVRAEKKAAGMVEIKFKGRVRGLSDQVAGFEGSGSIGGDPGPSLSLEFDRAIDTARLLRDRLPGPVLLRGVSVKAAPDGESIDMVVTDLGIKDPMVVSGPAALSRLVAGFEDLTARQVRISLDRSGGAGWVEMVRTMSVVGAAVKVLPASDRFGEMTLDEITLNKIDADLSRAPSSGEVRIAASGEMVVDVAGKEAGARGDVKVRLGSDGVLRELNGTISGPALVKMASGIHPKLLPWADASMGLKAVIKGDGQRYGVVGSVWGRNLTYFWTKLCLVPLTGLDVTMDFTAMLDIPKETLNLRVDPIAMGQARFGLELDFQRLFERPRVKLHFTVPKQRCEDVAAAIPPVMIPRLDGARFDGWMSLDVKADVDFRKVDKASLKVDADMSECRAQSLGPLVNVDRLNSRWFVHKVNEEDLDHPIRVGPATGSWTPLEDIPVPVQQAALATEDMLFFEHKGFQVGLMRRAVRLNLDQGWYVYGGSTISQQLVKNLFLSREKTLARKLEEAVIVWVMEDRLEKERILELYLNCIEFGLHIYGIRAAAREYYNKEPSELTALDGAFIMATKPKPRYAYKVYRKRAFNDWWVKRMKGILARLYDPMGAIDFRTSVTPDPCPPGGPRGRYLVPCFYYADEGVYTQPAVSPDTEVPPGMPEELPGDGGKPAPPTNR